MARVYDNPIVRDAIVGSRIRTVVITLDYDPDTGATDLSRSNLYVVGESVALDHTSVENWTFTIGAQDIPVTPRQNIRDLLGNALIYAENQGLIPSGTDSDDL